jgi:Pyrimidine dimer DNA glycosylase
MQTFLPYRSFPSAMRCLDYRRLGKQRVEAMQILNTLAGRSRGWRNHPAVLMWKGYEPSLRMYLRCAILEWKRRGYVNNMKLPRRDLCSGRTPAWITDDMIRSHRSNLLRKDRAYYSRFGWDVPNNLPYLWPKRYSSWFPQV